MRKLWWNLGDYHGDQPHHCQHHHDRRLNHYRHQHHPHYVVSSTSYQSVSLKSSSRSHSCQVVDLSNQYKMACRRPGCPFSHLDGPRRHRFCCNACKRGEHDHTINCSGHVYRTKSAFRIPANWACGGTWIEHIGWYMQKFNMPMSRSLVEEWHYHQSMMLLVKTNR